MERRVYYIGVRWNRRVPAIDRVELVLDPLGDWIRFNDSTWFLSTTEPQATLSASLQEILAEDQTLLVIALNPKDRFGLAPQWVWDWIDSQRGPTPRTVAEIVGQGPPIGDLGDKRSFGGRGTQ